MTVCLLVLRTDLTNRSCTVACRTHGESHGRIGELKSNLNDLNVV